MQPHKPPLTSLVFDFGGVLLDWDPRYLYRKLFDGDPDAMERFLKEIDFYNWNLQQDAGRPFSEGVAELSRRFPHYAVYIRAYADRWEESISGPIPDSLALLRRLREAGYPLYGLSNWSVETFRRAREIYPFLGWFETILVSGEVRLLKPDPRIYTLFLERIGRSAGECLFIDDSRENVATAEKLGFITIAYESPAKLERELVKHGVLTG